MSEVRAKKALGQHFLTDLNIARKICDSLSGGSQESPCEVLEVGCSAFRFIASLAIPPPYEF